MPWRLRIARGREQDGVAIHLKRIFYSVSDLFILGATETFFATNTIKNNGTAIPTYDFLNQ